MFRNLKNKKFIDNLNGNIITVLDQVDNMAILESNKKISIPRLLDQTYFEEYIDPKSFFDTKDTLYSFAEKIKNITDDRGNSNILSNSSSKKLLDNVDRNESAIIQYDPEEEKRILLEKAQSMYGSVSTSSRQQDLLKSFEDDDDLKDIIPYTAPKYVPPMINNNEEEVRRVEVDRNKIEEGIEEIEEEVEESPKRKSDNRKVNKIEDPIKQMFKNVKRNYDFSIELKIENKIPRLDFIEMMEDSYELSIIDFLANEFTMKLLENPIIISDMIKDKIKELIDSNKPQKKLPIKKETIKNPIIEEEKAVEKIEKKPRKTVNRKKIENND
jgi:hypothetical protein